MANKTKRKLFNYVRTLRSPQSKLRLVWSIIFSLAVVECIVSVPIGIALNSKLHAGPWFAFDLLADLIFWIDIV